MSWLFAGGANLLHGHACACGYSRGERGSGYSRALSAVWIFAFSINEFRLKQTNHYFEQKKTKITKKTI
ncbi:hypothetical protein OH491_12175 [Termitidicoccus mucosus]|uniref:hypothetical protein n=1 Tax=Termitidicoccus mucosus TaxID=1184151 RepID=UPI0011AB3115